MFQKTSLLGTTALSSPQQTTYDDVRGEDVMTDPRVIADVRAEFEDRGIYIEDDDELMRKFYDDQTIPQLNATVGPFFALQRAEAATPEARARQARLRDAHDKLPFFMQSGGVGAATALPSYLKALALDPINAVGGFIGAGGKGVAKAAQVARMNGRNPALAAAKAAALRGAAYEGALGAGFGGVYSVGQQNVDMKLGLQDSFSFGRLGADIAGEAVFSGALGAGIGGAFGAVRKGGANLDDVSSYQKELLDGADAARANGDLEEEDQFRYLYGLSVEENSLDTGAGGTSPEFRLADDASPEADPSAPPAAAPEADKAAAAAQPKNLVRTSKPSKNAEKLAAEAGLDLSIDPKTKKFLDERVEDFVLTRAATTGKVVYNGIHAGEVRKILEGIEDTTSDAAGVAASAVKDQATKSDEAADAAATASRVAMEKAEVEAAGITVTDADTQANIERAAKEDGVSVEAVNAAIKEKQDKALKVAKLFKQLTPEEGQVTQDRITQLQAGGMDALDASIEAAEATIAARSATTTTPSKRSSDRTAVSMEAMETNENAGRSLTDFVDSSTMRTYRVPGAVQAMFRGSMKLPTQASIARAEAEAAARASLRRMEEQRPDKKGTIASWIADKNVDVDEYVRATAARNKIDLADGNSLPGNGFGVEGYSVYVNQSATRGLMNMGDSAVPGASRISMGDIPAGSVVIFEASIGSKGLSFGGDTLEAAQEVLERWHASNNESAVVKQAERAERAALIKTFEDEKGVTRIAFGETAEAQRADTTLNAPASKGDLRLTAVYVGPDKYKPSNHARQATDQQVKDGKTLHDLIGMPRNGQSMRPNWNPENWAVYFVPPVSKDGNKLNKILAAVEGIEPVKLDRLSAPARIDTLDDVIGAPLYSRIAENELPKPEGEMEQALFNTLNQRGVGFSTYQDLLTRDAEMWRIDLKDGNAKAQIQFAKMFYTYYDRILPNGVLYPNGSRVAANKALESIYEGYPTEVLEMLKRLMNGPMGAGAPIIRKNTELGTRPGEMVGGAYKPAAVNTAGDDFDVARSVTEAGAIELNPEFTGHPVHVLVHELAHWSTDHIMTPGMKGEFFTELEKFIDDNGNVDLKKIGLGDAPEEFLDVGKNFQEIWANLMTKWASDHVFRTSLERQGIGFFQKVARVFQRLFDFFMSGGVPKNFDPLFRNVLSDTDRGMIDIYDANYTPKNATAKHIQKRNEEMAELSLEWSDAIIEGASLEELTRRTLGFLHSLTNTKEQNKAIARASGGSIRGRNTGFFWPTRLIRPSIRGAISEINKVTKSVVDDPNYDYRINFQGEELDFTEVFGYDENMHRQVAALYETGAIRDIFEKIGNVFESEFEKLESGQAQNVRVQNRRDAEAIAPVKNKKAERQKDRALSIAKSALYKKNVAKSDESVLKAMNEAGVPANSSFDELVQMLNFGEGLENEPQNKIIAQRIKRILDAEPVSDRRNKHDGKTSTTLLRELALAADRNDLKTARELGEAYKRAGGTQKMAPQDGLTDKLVMLDRNENAMSLDGLSLNARSQILGLQKRMNSRDGEIEATMRQLFYRTMNLVGAADRSDGMVVNESALAPLFGGRRSAEAPALTEASGDFQALRKRLRVIASGLKKGEDTVRDLALLAVRGSEDLPVDTINGKAADEFMADVVTELLGGRATFDQVFPASPNRAMLLQLARNYMDRTTYLANGLVSSEALRKKYPGLTMFGDLFTENKRPMTSISGIGGVLPAPVAADGFAEALKQGAEGLRAGIRKFTQGSFTVGPDGNPMALYVPVRRGSKVDNFGRAQTNGMFGLATYTSASPQGALRLKGGDIPAKVGMEEKAQDLIARVANIDARLLSLRGQKAGAATSAEAAVAQDKITEALRRREGLLQQLDLTGRTFDDVAPVVTRARTEANFQQSAGYGNSDPLVLSLLDEINSADERSGTLFGASIPEQIEGDDLFAEAVDALERSGMSERKAITTLTQRLRREGYEAIAGTMDDDGVARPIYAILSGDNVRSLKAPDLSIDEPADPVLDRGLGLAFWELVANEAEIPVTASAAVEDYMALAGAGKATSEAVSNMITGARVGPTLSSARDALLSGADGRLRRAGLSFLADRFDEFTVEHARSLGGILMPVIDGVNQLPGMPKGLLGKTVNYMTSAMQGNSMLGLNFKAPAPSARVREALIDPTQYSKLANDAERKMWDKINTLLRSQLSRMKSAGVLVGDLGPNYYPFVWNPEIVRRRPDDFKSLLMSLHALEQPRGSQAEHQAFADKVFANITENDTGVVDFDPDHAGAVLSHTDFSRVLNFQNHRELLPKAQEFMEQSLMATVVRYFDETERAIQQANYLGVGGHAVMDYAKAAQDGVEGMIDVLSTDKIFTATNRHAMAGGGGVVKRQKQIKIKMLNPATAREAVTKAMAAFNTSGAPAARAELMAAYPRSSAEEVKTYRRRVDAVVAAMEDFKGNPAALHEDDLRAAEGYSRVLMRKSATNASNGARKLSRAMRTFQNVTLLSYATITSFSDIALPIIRSGDFKAAWKGWTKYIGDRDYRDSIRRIGVNLDGVTHERLAQLIGDPQNVAQSTYFKAIGLTPWTNVNRAGAAAIGMEAMRHHMMKLKQLGAGAADTADYRFHERFLRRHGMIYDPTQPIPEMDASTEAGKMYQRAVIRFVDNTVFSPKPQDMPLYANGPWGGMVYQLKSFSLMYGRFAKEIVIDDGAEAFKEMARGNFGVAAKYMTRPTLFMSLGPAIAAGAMATKDIVMSRGGEDSQSAGLNMTRKFSNTIGREWEDEELDTLAGWYFQSFMQAGGMGLLGDLFITTAEQQDNGAYGKQRIASAVLGPTYGAVFGSGLNLVSGATDKAGELLGGEGSAGTQRQALREVAQRIPVLGGNRAFREGFVDAFVEAENGKSSGVGGGPYKRNSYGTFEY